MTSILSAISGQLIQTLALSTFIPVTVFLFLFQIFIAPFLVTERTIFRQLESLDSQWQVLVFSIAAIILTGLLYNFNILIIRLYEGYPWKDSCIGEWRIEHYKSQLKATQVRVRGMRTLLRHLDTSDTRYSEISKEWKRLLQRLNTELPEREASVLPTRLGNVIRSFEYYSTRQYGMDAVTLWPLLSAKIDKDYMAIIDGAKASFDFTINSSFLSLILAVMVVYIRWRYPNQMSLPWWVELIFFIALGCLLFLYLWTDLLDLVIAWGSLVIGILIVCFGWGYPTQMALPWVAKLILFIGLAYVFYISSIKQAIVWGQLVKGAFDLYRRDLLKQLGYTRLPMGEWELWDKTSRQILFGSTNLDSAPVQEQSLCFARGEPREVDLEITRGFSHSIDNTVTVTIGVKNIDSRQRIAKNIIITDTLPDGFEYVWNTAAVGNNHVSVSGIDPYHFEIGREEPLLFGRSILLTYTITALT